MDALDAKHLYDRPLPDWIVAAATSVHAIRRVGSSAAWYTISSSYFEEITDVDDRQGVDDIYAVVGESCSNAESAARAGECRR